MATRSGPEATSGSEGFEGASTIERLRNERHATGDPPHVRADERRRHLIEARLHRFCPSPSRPRIEVRAIVECTHRPSGDSRDERDA